VGAYLYSINPHLPLALTLVGDVGAMICIARMVEPARHKKRPEKHPLRDMIDSVHYSLKGHANVGAMILYGAILFSATKIIMWSQQPYYMAAKIDEKWFGVFMAVGFMLAGTSSHLAHRFDRWVKDRVMLSGAWLMALVLVMIASFAPTPIGIAALILGGSCIYGLCGPRVSDLINRSVPSARRATILSTASLGSSLVFMPVSAVIGAVADASGIRDALWTMGIWLLVAGIIIMILANIKSRRALKLKSIL
jgi:MFS family permease